MSKKVSTKKKNNKYQPTTLKDLVAKITKKNVHKETNRGKLVGREVW